MKYSHKVDGRPSFQFYPDDWMTSYDLRQCSSFDRGLWTDMLCIMWVAPRRGFLETQGGPIESRKLARLCGESEADVKQGLSRLLEEHVCSKDDDGTIYNRRMVRDEKQRVSKAEAGRKGGKVSRKKAKGGPSASSSSPKEEEEKEKKKKSDPAGSSSSSPTPAVGSESSAGADSSPPLPKDGRIPHPCLHLTPEEMRDCTKCGGKGWYYVDDTSDEENIPF